MCYIEATPDSKMQAVYLSSHAIANPDLFIETYASAMTGKKKLAQAPFLPTS